MMVVVKKPGQLAEIRTIRNELDELQRLVGGYVEAVTIVPNRLVMLCNEEGKLLDLPKNVELEGDIIRGNVVFVGVKGDNFSDIQPGDAQMLINEGGRYAV